MIIAFAGRCRSGKTQLANICEKNGFQRLYFALPLKKLIGKLIDGTIEDVDKLKNVKSEYILDDDKIELVSKETNIPLKTVEEKLKNHIFNNTREMMQYIGTDLIREYNQDWHVNRVTEMIDSSKNYVFDDLRFPNEKKMLEMMGAICFYLVRPNLEYVSNHISETSLRWQDFDNIIINDKTLDYLMFNWTNFIENGIGKSIISRSQLLNKIYNDKETNDSLMSNEEPFNIFDSLFINKYEFTYDPKFFLYGIKNARLENFNNSLFRIYYDNGNTEIVTNPLMIEDLKRFYN